MTGKVFATDMSTSAIPRLDDFLNMTWLRPENVVWDAAAARLIGPALMEGSNVAEIGIGNGFFTFMALGGKFKKELDWYHNVNLGGFWKNQDIYDHVGPGNLGRFIEKAPAKRLRLAVDHKANLLDQVKQLEFVDKLVLADANKPVDVKGADTVYSNIIYWLNNPLEVISNLSRQLESGARAILVFPNPSFLNACRSYSGENKTWKMLNRGRAETLMWTMDMDEFTTQVRRKTAFRIETYTRYLSRLTLQTWDIGFRPFSPHLIKMANNLSPSIRMEIKEEWCATAMPFLQDLAGNELEKGPIEGGFNFVVLRKH
jgi:hypothetical protein